MTLEKNDFTKSHLIWPKYLFGTLKIWNFLHFHGFYVIQGRILETLNLYKDGFTVYFRVFMSYKVEQVHTSSYKLIQGHTRWYKVIQGHTRSYKFVRLNKCDPTCSLCHSMLFPKLFLILLFFRLRQYRSFIKAMNKYMYIATFSSHFVMFFGLQNLLVLLSKCHNKFSKIEVFWFFSF